MAARTPTIALLAILVATPALAGCLEDTAGSPAGSTALDLRPAAEDRAREWASDARLSAASTHEGHQARYASGDEDRPQDEPYWERNVDDGEADGRAEVWQFEFVSATRNGTAFQVVVDADGAVVSTSTEDRRPGDEPVTEDVLDSPAAVDAAAEANASLRRGLESPNATVSLALEHDGDRGVPVWQAAGGGDGVGSLVEVHAVTGEALEVEG